MADHSNGVVSSQERLLRDELVRLLQWFRDREERSGHQAQIIHIGLALDRAARSKLESHVEKVDKALQEYLSGYEFRGDDGDHTPTKAERILIEDAIQGLMVDDDFVDAWNECVDALAATQKGESHDP